MHLHQLLDKTERCGDEGLGGNELHNPSIYATYVKARTYRGYNTEDKHDPGFHVMRTRPRRI
jgi:hypothetical protein